jgi:hypothetical protein
LLDNHSTIWATPPASLVLGFFFFFFCGTGVWTQGLYLEPLLFFWWVFLR